MQSMLMEESRKLELINVIDNNNLVKALTNMTQLLQKNIKKRHAL